MRIIYRDGRGTMHLKWVVEDTDRHGNVRVYFRRNGKKTRLLSTPGTPEFDAEYQQALADKRIERQGARIAPRSHCAGFALSIPSPWISRLSSAETFGGGFLS